jgi:sec-independent protein translocase protein TatB
VFGLTFDKLLVIGVIAVFVLGPERLPHYAAQLGRLVRTLRDLADGAKDRLRDEMGPEFDEVDWKKLDPRQYDPRRIIREALLEDPPPVSIVRPPGAESAFVKRSRTMADGAAAPFDSEAT